MQFFLKNSAINLGILYNMNKNKEKSLEQFIVSTEGFENNF